MKVVPDFPTKEEFLDMEDKEVASIVTDRVDGNICVLVPDGNRKAGLVLWGYDPSAKDFDRDLFNRIHSKFLSVVRTFFENGIRIMFIPLLMHTNFDRGKVYMKAAMSDGLSHLLEDPDWLGFYDECNIRIRFYGDREYVKERGYEELIKKMERLESLTKDNDGVTLFYGVACNRTKEEVRLAKMGIEHFNRTGEIPIREDLVRDYYGTNVPYVGFFVRPTEVRDSDVQPILISGPKTQMYFPVCPVAFLSKRTIRSMLFDLLNNRVASGGTKMYSKGDVSSTDLARVREFYLSNQEVVLGVGWREGPFWLPNTWETK